MDNDLEQSDDPVIDTFDEATQKQLASLVLVGCTLRTAARVAGIDRQRLRAVLEHDRKLSERLLVAEAVCEFTHLERLREVSKDPKNYRVSIWLLERRFPFRYMPRPFSGISAAQLQATLRTIGEELARQFPDAEGRDRIMASLTEIQTALSSPSMRLAEDA